MQTPVQLLAGYPRDKDFAKTNLNHELRRSSHRPLQTHNLLLQNKAVSTQETKCWLSPGNGEPSFHYNITER